MLVYRRAFAAAPSLRLATGGRSIAAPPLRYSTVADAAAAAPVTPAAPTASATESSPTSTPQSPQPAPAKSNSPAPKNTPWAKPQRAYKAPYSRPSFASRNSPIPSSASSPALAKGSTTKAPPSTTPLESTTVNEVLRPSVPSQARPSIHIPDSLELPRAPRHLIWKPIPPPAQERPRTEYLKNIDWTTSYHGLGTSPVTPAQFAVLARPLSVADIEVKPDGILYMPEIRYRRRLNEAFGPMGWGIAPRGEVVVGKEIVTREYALIIDGCFVSTAQGVNNYFSNESIPQAVEGAKSNALMRCCKDIGVASELWDPAYIRWFTKTYVTTNWVEHTIQKKKKKWSFKKDAGIDLPYPYKLVTGTN